MGIPLFGGSIILCNLNAHGIASCMIDDVMTCPSYFAE